MQETPGPGRKSAIQCKDTTSASTQNTSGGTRKPGSANDKKTKSRPPVSDTNVFSARREPLPRYLVTDLYRLTFQVAGVPYRADDTDHTDAWTLFATQQGEVAGSPDWDDLEERADFLNLLYEYCDDMRIPFPLTEKDPENFNARQFFSATDHTREPYGGNEPA